MREHQTSRIHSLDGLRGLAALVVLVHHSFVSIAVLGGAYFSEPVLASLGWLVYSPLHLVWAGPEAVLVFFILSGLVLTLPALNRGYVWRAYYPSRLLRLYLPVVASVVLALTFAIVIPRSGTVGHGTWMESHNVRLGIVGFLRDATLVAPDWLNGPLWSLRWEVIFSLLLPLYLIVAVRFARWWWALVAGSIILSFVGSISGQGWLTYLPMFMIGCALATSVRDGRTSNSRAWPWLTGAALLGITSAWWLAPVLSKPTVVVAPVVLASAFMIVAAAISWKGARTMLELRPVQWLGTISFSLYLVHDPIVVGVATLLPLQISWLTPLVAIPISIGTAWLFFKFVERPAHRLARVVSSALTVKKPELAS